MAATANNVEMRGLEFKITDDSTQAVKSLNELSKTLTGLKKAVGGGINGLGKTATQINTLKNALKNLNTGDAASKMSKLATSLSGLSSAASGVNIGTRIEKLNAALSKLKWTDGDKLDALANGLRPLSELGRANMTSFINQLKKLPDVIEQLENSDLDKFTQQMKDLAAAMKPFADEMQKVSNGFSAFPSRIQKVIASTNQYNSVMSSANKSGGMAFFAGGFKIGATIYALRQISDWISTAITKSNEYQENLNLFTVAMGDYADQAYEYGQTVSDVLGIDFSEWIRNQGVFNTLLTGFGNTADRAALMSQNLTQLGYDLSSFFNISVEDAMQKLQSGISGELEPLRRLGFDLSQARLEAEALSLGIDKSVMSMTQAEKAELRYYAIMTQVTSAQGDLARTLESPANQLRILKAQFSMAAQAIGNIFIPALNAILPYAIAVVEILREVANAVASLFGFELAEVDYSGISTGMSDAASGASDLSDNLGSAAGEAKKLKNFVTGIDELNVMPDTSAAAGGAGGAGAGIGAGGGGFDFELPEYDFLGDAITTKVDSIKDTLKESIAEITGILSLASLEVGALLAFTGINIPLGVALMALGALGLWKVATGAMGSVSETVAQGLGLIMGALGGAKLAIGLILALTGHVPTGVALMALGAAELGIAGAINMNATGDLLQTALTILEGVVIGIPLAVGAFLAFTGANIPVGLALMAAGLAGYATAVINWDSITDPVDKKVAALSTILGTAFLAIGAVLAFSGTNIPLGIGLMIGGASVLATTASLNWNELSDAVKDKISVVTAALSIALLALGAFLAFSGVSIALGLSLMAGGAVTLITTKALKWNDLSDNVKRTITIVATAVGAALLGLGAVLAFSGVAIPLGIGLMAAGAVTLGSAAALNWNSVKESIKTIVSAIAGILAGSLIVIGILLCLSGAGIGLGLALIAAGVSLSYAAWTLDDNPITRFVKKMANNIIGLINMVIDAINDLFHIKFDGLEIMGKQIIPSFDIKLVNLKHIPTFADGGFVDQGQLFIAREAGAEMVGAIGRKTTVANNDQIVEGISAGVTVANDGVIAAIYALLNAVEAKDFSVNIGDDEIGRSYDRYNTRRGERVSRGAFANAY